MDEEISYRAIYENTEIPIFIIITMEDGELAYGGLNPAYERAMGLRAADAVGKRPEEVPSLTLEDAAALRANCQRCLDCGEAIHYEERRVVGSVETWWLTQLAPVRNEAGRLVQIIGSSVDITELKRMEEALQKSQVLLNKAQVLGKIGGWDWNPATNASSWTDEVFHIHEIPVDKETFNRVATSLECYRPEDRPVIYEAFRRCIEKGISYDLELPFTDYAGTQKWVRTGATPLFEGDKVVHVYGYIMDITERKRAEEAIRTLNETLERRVLERTAQLKEAVNALNSEIADRKRAQEALRRSDEEKTILNHIANIFLTVPNEAMYGEVLAVVLRVMNSRYGVFGYIGESGELIVPSLTREIWDQCQVPDKSIEFPPGSWGDSLWARALREKKAFRSDGPFHTPEGHIPIDHFLTVPVVFGQEAIGLISVANKEGGYAGEDERLLKRIAGDVSPILQSRLQRDVQERKRLAAEEALRGSEEKYRLLVANAGEAIFIAQDEAVKFPNPKALEMTGYSAQELAGMPFTDLVHPGDRAFVERHLRLLEGERPPETYPFKIIDRRGAEMWVQLTTAPILWEEKPGTLCFLKNITEEKKLEAQFMQAQKMEAIGRLAGGVAHDFNNMLSVILGFADLALDKVDRTLPLHADLQEIRKAAERSADLTRQLLAFARRQTIAPKVLDLNETVTGMLQMLQRLIGEDIDLAWMPGDGLWPVRIDPAQIDQILANLVVNARDAIIGLGKVTIETENVVFEEAYCAEHPDFIPGRYVMLAVSDDGCGMTRDVLDRLFEPFFTTKGLGQGAGLGLSTVYGIVKQNEGFINVYSEPDRGSTFRLYLPRHAGEVATAPAEVRAQPARGAAETVLLVEDEAAVVNLGQRMLEGLGYTVLTAGRPGEALRLAAGHAGEIHLLIVDVVMPEMTGRELAARLLSVRPNLKQLFMSGYTANVIAHSGVLEQGVHFLQKPFSIEDLAAKVREALEPN